MLCHIAQLQPSISLPRISTYAQASSCSRPLAMSHPRYKVKIQVLNPEPPHLRPHPSFHYELPLRQFPSVSARHFLGHLPFSKRDTCGLSPSSLIIGRHLIRVPFLHHTAFASCSVRHSQPSSRPSISASLGPPHPSCQPWRFPSLLPFWPTAMSHPIMASV